MILNKLFEVIPEVLVGVFLLDTSVSLCNFSVSNEKGGKGGMENRKQKVFEKYKI